MSNGPREGVFVRLRRWWNQPYCVADTVTLGGGTGMDADVRVCHREGCDPSAGVCVAERERAA